MKAAQRGRSWSAVGFLLTGGVGIISSTQTWLAVERTDGGEAILVPGANALPLLPPLSLAVLAMGAALAISGLVMRYLLGAVAIVAAVGLAWSTGELIVSPPLTAVASTVTDTTGLAGVDALGGIVASIEPSAWPTLAFAAWCLLVLAGVFVLLSARRWRTGGRRFRTASPDSASREGPVDPIDSWDELSRGSDPTR